MWLDIKQACKKYGRSESGIRRIVKDLKQNDQSKLQFEKLKNGSEKILIDSSYLDSYFNKSSDTNNDTYSSDTLSEVVKMLSKQIEIKDKQLENKDRQIAELHILFGKEQGKFIELDTPGQATKKRWWQRKK